MTLAENTPQQAASGAEHVHLHCCLHHLSRCWSQHPPYSLPFVPVCRAPTRVRELPPEGTDRKPRASSSQQGSLPPAYLTPAQSDKLRLCLLCTAPGKEYAITPRLSRLEANQTELHSTCSLILLNKREGHSTSPRQRKQQTVSQDEHKWCAGGGEAESGAHCGDKRHKTIL